jgi:hypothetical protein
MDGGFSYLPARSVSTGNIDRYKISVDAFYRPALVECFSAWTPVSSVEFSPCQGSKRESPFPQRIASGYIDQNH